MVELLDRLRSRFVFVVGKGGVGKTTTAGAVALALADREIPTRLVSVDPAHSMGDLFEQVLEGGRPRPSRCVPALVLEEFDGHAWMRAWISSIRGPITDLFDRATYLDRADIDAFLDVSLPGLDEVAAALRLAELEEEGERRILVDTAPTGHALRLFDCTRVVESWARALDAMVEKASVVGSFLAGRTIRLEAEDVLEDLQDRIGRFQERVLARADVVVVTRPQEVVWKETDELVRALRDRRMSVSAVVSVGRERGFPAGLLPGEVFGSAPGAFVVPELSMPVGCDGLRRWVTAVEPVEATDVAAQPEPGADSAMPEPAATPAAEPSGEVRSLLDRELLFFAGKGGVGKSTCASAAAVALASDGPVHLLSTDPAGSLTDLFGVDVSASGSEIAPGLVARQVDAEKAFARFVEGYREGIAEVFERLGIEETAALDRKILESLLDLAPPGIDEMVALRRMLDWRAGKEGILIVDAAPTGHFLRLLEMPALALSWIRSAMGIVVRYRAALGLNELAEELVSLSRVLRAFVAELEDEDRSGVVVVTGGDHLVRRETGRLAARLEREGISTLATIVNRSESVEPPDRFRGSARATTGVEGALIRAPFMTPAPVGTDALSDFFARWERWS